MNGADMVAPCYLQIQKPTHGMYVIKYLLLLDASIFFNNSSFCILADAFKFVLEVLAECMRLFKGFLYLERAGRHVQIQDTDTSSS